MIPQQGKVEHCEYTYYVILLLRKNGQNVDFNRIRKKNVYNTN